LFPVVCEEVDEDLVPPQLRRLNYVYFAGDGRTFATGLGQLSRALNVDVNWIREHTRLGELASRWNARDRSEAFLLRGDAIPAATQWMAARPVDAPEPTFLQRELISASEAFEQARQAKERAQQAAFKDAELQRIRAEREAERLKARATQDLVLQKARSRQRRIVAVLSAVILFALAGAGIAYHQVRISRELAARSEIEIKAQKELAVLQTRIAEEQKKNAEEQRRNAEEQKKRADANAKLAELESQLKAALQAKIEQTTEDRRIARVPADSSGLGTALPGSTPTFESLRRRISDSAIEQIVLFETGGRGFYDSQQNHPYWPGVSSGVVLGFGYDLGYVTVEQFKQDWSQYLPPDAVGPLTTVVGMKGPEASAIVDRFKDIKITWDTAQTVFRTATLPRFAKLVDQSLPNVEMLPPDSYGALVSLVFNRGASFARSGDRYDEMRKIRELMESKNFLGIPAELRKMARLWPGMVGLQKRREAEADLFESGLGITSEVRSAMKDLESDIRPVRVAARMALAAAYATAEAKAGKADYYVAYLFQTLDSSNTYRVHLGTLTALGDVPNGWSATAGQRAKLEGWRQNPKFNESSYKAEINNAIRNIRAS